MKTNKSAWSGVGIASCADLAHIFCVCLHIIERPEPPDKSAAARNVGLVGIQLNAVRRAFLKGQFGASGCHSLFSGIISALINKSRFRISIIVFLYLQWRHSTAQL